MQWGSASTTTSLWHHSTWHHRPTRILIEPAQTHHTQHTQCKAVTASSMLQMCYNFTLIPYHTIIIIIIIIIACLHHSSQQRPRRPVLSNCFHYNDIILYRSCNRGLTTSLILAVETAPQSACLLSDSPHSNLCNSKEMPAATVTVHTSCNYYPHPSSSMANTHNASL